MASPESRYSGFDTGACHRAAHCADPVASPRNDGEVASPLHASISQHEAGSAGDADAVAEGIGYRARVGADPYLVEGARAAAAEDGGENARVLIADHWLQVRHGTGVARQRPIAVEAGGKLHAPELRGRELHVLFKFGNEGIGRALQ